MTPAIHCPLASWEKLFTDHSTKIETWFRQQWQVKNPPFYASVDLRNAGFKIAPVDTNLFPAGFNNLNLNPQFIPLCIQAAQSTLSHYYPGLTKILIIPENHTRNQAYWNNVYILRMILSQAGVDVRVGSLIPLQNPQLTDHGPLTIETIERTENKIHINDFIPELILLNNDLADGVPDILKNLSQVITPPLSMGWENRLKSRHFSHYQKIAVEFSKLIDIDPWIINPYFESCGKVNFKDKEGIECVAHYIETLLQLISKKYSEYHIKQKPFVIVKADAGTYGMGIMTAFSPADVLHMNRKQRNKMSIAKGNRPITQVIVQEGIYTAETRGIDQAVAEPVVYTIGSNVVGGFYRVHTERGPNENLNAPGMHFEPLAFDAPCNQVNQDPMDPMHRFYIYGVIARLASLAANDEIAEVTL